MSLRPEALSGAGRNSIDLSELTLPRRLNQFIPVGLVEIREVLATQKEIQAGVRSPIEINAGGRQLAKLLSELIKEGYKIGLQSPASGQIQEAQALIGELDRCLITPRTLAAFSTDQAEPQPKTQTLTERFSGPAWKILAASAAAATVLTGLGDTVAAIHQTLPDSFQTSAKAFADACTDYTKIAGDAYGPEMSRECLEQKPQNISAKDYVKDSTDNVIRQRAVVNLNELWESVKDPVTGAFSDFKFVSNVSIGRVTSMISSSDGNTIIAGGEIEIRSGITALAISHNAGKTWEEIKWPYQNSGSTIDLFRMTDINFLGNNGNYEDGIGPFIISIDQNTKKAAVKAASLTTVQPVSVNIGSTHNLGITSIDNTNHQVGFASTASFNLQSGLLIGKIDYTTGIGSVENITQTLINGNPVRLGFLQGNGIYRDSQGHLHIKTSDFWSPVLYDIDTVTKKGTYMNYGNICDDKGISNYMKGSLAIGAIDVFRDSQGNLHTKAGGGYSSTIADFGGAIFVDLDTSECIDLEPKPSVIEREKDMLRQKINGQMGYEVVIWRFGKAFIPDGGLPIYTDRNLGGNKNTNNYGYRLYLPLVTKSYLGEW